MRLNISVEQPRVGAAGCVRCGRPVMDVFRAVVYRRAMYHAECWLQLVAAPAQRQSAIADYAVLAAKDAAS